MFLATTANADFWDTTQPLLLLGEWCYLNQEKIDQNTTCIKLFEHPYSQSENMDWKRRSALQAVL